LASIVGTWKLVGAVARDRNGKTLPAPYGGQGVVGSFVDVTATVEARHALERSEHRFRDLTELSAD